MSRIFMAICIFAVVCTAQGGALALQWRPEGGANLRPVAGDQWVQSLAGEVLWDDLLADLEWLVEMGTRWTLDPNIFTVADSLEARLATYGLTTEQWDYELDGTTAPNVLATQIGTTHPDSIFVICAHFDAYYCGRFEICPGADDNASGTIAVLSAARLLAGRQMACTVQYVLFSGEERGKKGSQAYVAEQIARGVNIAGALNFDMIGWWEEGVPFDLDVVADARSRWMADTVAYCASAYAGMPYVLHEVELYGGGDADSFWEQGIPAVSHKESWGRGPEFNPYYHTSDDLVENLHTDFLTRNVRVAVTTLATLGGLVKPFTPTYATLSTYPNPFTGSTKLLLQARDLDGPMSADLYDLQGRRVQSVTMTVRDDRAEATLNAVDRYGNPLPAGIYLMRVDSPSGPVSCRVTILR